MVAAMVCAPPADYVPVRMEPQMYAVHEPCPRESHGYGRPAWTCVHGPIRWYTPHGDEWLRVDPVFRVLSPRARAALWRGGYHTREAIAEASDDAILRLHYTGKGILADIRRVVPCQADVEVLA